MAASAPTWAEEHRLWREGFRLVAGIDEVGRGPLAGPVTAAAAILDPYSDDPYYGLLRDSKALSPTQRERLAPLIAQSAIAVGIGSAEPAEIDAMGIVQATRTAMARAVAALPTRPDFLLVDALPLPGPGLPFRAIIKGDALCRSIAAASIVAKVARDRHMSELDAAYPGYDFARHKGYPTQEHMERLARLGPCPIHRRSFAPVRALIQPQPQSPPQIQQTRGRATEDATARHLEAMGYSVLKRNFQSPWGEIDIVAQHDGTIAFVEVKARRSDAMGSAVESVTRRKQQRLVLAAQDYLQRNGLDQHPWRIDVVAIRLGPGGTVQALEHLENAVAGF